MVLKCNMYRRQINYIEGRWPFLSAGTNQIRNWCCLKKEAPIYWCCWLIKGGIINYNICIFNSFTIADTG